MLGYSGDAIAYFDAKFGQGSGQIWLHVVKCTGHEHSITECSINSWGLHNCDHSEDAGVFCSGQAPVRLIGGNSTGNGRVELFYNGQWGTVCDDYWDRNDAVVICRMLGYSGDAVAYHRAKFGHGSGQIWLDDVRCSGNEHSINQCSKPHWGTHNCNHEDDAGVSCSNVPVRLIGGNSTGNGRVELFYNGQWGTVCDGGWDRNDAVVICHMLGYSGGVAYNSAQFGHGSGQIWLDEVNCTGHEHSITECSINSWGVHDCDHSEDAGVFCSNATVRLIGGNSPGNGRVELYHNGQWGTVCDDSWDRNDALVICRMLGYNDVDTYNDVRFREGSGEIWLNNIQCTGKEHSITECGKMNWGIHNCKHSEDVGVSCRNATVRLIGGNSPGNGRVELFHNGQWGTVCDDSWDRNDALVICRMLGYNDVDTYNDVRFREGSGEIWLNNIQCTGKEHSITECGKMSWGNHNCKHSEDVGVSCRNATVRLIGGNSPGNGRVELFHNGQWGTVCDDSWDRNDALVICRMLGYNDVDTYNDVRFREGSGEIWLNNIQCTGKEHSITECGKMSWGNHNCKHSEDVGVSCSNISVRLEDGSNTGNGRVELLRNGQWGTVCDHSWDRNDALVICRMLGYSDGVAYRGARSGEGSGIIWLDDVECTGNEHSIAECRKGRWGNHNCQHGEDAGVSCSNVTVRLIGGNITGNGRVEPFYNGQWGTVCDNSWDRNESLIICHMLGYSDAIPYSGARFGEGSGIIWLDDVECTGTEHTITECRKSNWGVNNCTHSEDVGVSCSNVTVRLNGGNSTGNGRVELFYNGQWGTMCDNLWERNDALVICHMLGYSDAIAYSGGRFEESTGIIWVSDVNCTGNEHSITECRKSNWGIHNCGHSAEAGVSCSNVSVRLVGGNSTDNGRVELFYNGNWGRVCDNSWDRNDALVICRMLGYSDGIAYNETRTGGDSGTIWLNNIECTGNEHSITECRKSSWGNHHCQNMKDIGVFCRNVTVRLIGGNSTGNGRVELFYNGQWGTVCDDEWDRNDALVICHMLGYNDAVAYSGAKFGDGSGTIWLDNVECTGDEHSITECGKISWGNHNCKHSEDAGVFCSNITTVRLINGTSTGNGRVELFYNGQWGTVCDNSWDRNAALVICHMLGYSDAIAYSGARFGEGSGRIWLDNVECTGNEHSITVCNKSSWGIHNCNHSKDAGVFCGNLSARLVGGNNTENGRVELFYNGQWGTVCDDSWDRNDALVICRMFGYSDAVAYSGATFGEGSGTIWLDNVECTGNEHSITECGKMNWGNHNCEHSEDAGVSCRNVSARLVGGSSTENGRVELFYNGQWGTVCDHSWSFTEALVICRMLGYNNAVAYSGTQFGKGSGTIWLDNTECTGNEHSITECNKSRWGIHNCKHSEDAGVSCSNVLVRLVGGNSTGNGRVELFYNEEWGTVCDDSWDYNDAIVICRMLRYSDAVAYKEARFGEGSGKIWLDDVKCTGNEHSITECSRTSWGIHDCEHSEDAGVSCRSAIPPEGHVTVRLVGGNSTGNGRVELFYNRRWGTVCDDSWDYNDAIVICRMLGYSYAVPYNGARFGEGVGTIWLSGVHCKGYEYSITECSKSSWGISNCDHSQDAGVSCV